MSVPAYRKKKEASLWKWTETSLADPWFLDTIWTPCSPGLVGYHPSFLTTLGIRRTTPTASMIDLGDTGRQPRVVALGAAYLVAVNTYNANDATMACKRLPCK